MGPGGSGPGGSGPGGGTPMMQAIPGGAVARPFKMFITNGP